MSIRFEFDPDKLIEILLHVAPRVGGDMYRCLKILYLADKCHLERYGNVITGDEYFALDYGPTPSKSYDIIKYAAGRQSGYHHGATGARDAFSVTGNSITVLRDADVRHLSASDIECLDATIQKHKSKDFGSLKKIVHDDAYHATNRNQKISIQAIASTLPNHSDIVQHLEDPYPGPSERPD